MVDIQSPTAENRRGKKERKKKIEKTTGRKYNVCICYAGRPYQKKCITRSNIVVWTSNAVIAHIVSAVATIPLAGMSLSSKLYEESAGLQVTGPAKFSASFAKSA